MASDICLTYIEHSSYQDDSSTPQTVTRNYTIKVTSASPTRFIAETDLRADSECPLVDPDYANLYRRTIEVRKAGTNENWFEGTVSWERWTPETVDTEFLSGSITRTTQTVLQSANRVGSYAVPGETPTDNFGFINADQSGVTGIEVSFPVMSFNIRRIYPNNSFTLAFLADAYNYVGKPNSVVWRNFAVGEIMLTGVDGDDSDPEKDSIAYSFDASPNQSNIEFAGIKTDGTPGTITVPLKRGFDVLSYVTIPDPTGNATVTGKILPRLHTIYVDEPTDYVDLNGLIT